VPLRFIGALHDLVLGEDAPEFAGAFPGDADAVIRRLPDLLERRSAAIASFMTTPPQTNEVNRSTCLLGGFLTVAKETGLPLRTFELGASAGLNLNWDRYAYDLGEVGRWGDPASPVKLGARWRGAPPPLEAEIRVLERRGVDRDPIDLRQPLAARRLQAYVWPDQAQRLGRLRAAIALALQAGVVVEQADAADWAERRVDLAPGATSVLYHSIVWQYLPPATQARLLSVIRRAADEASDQAPFAWLRMEADASFRRCELKLDLWPRGEGRLLANVHPHGAEVEWLDG
jgi:hypothetical protein